MSDGGCYLRRVDGTARAEVRSIPGDVVIGYVTRPDAVQVLYRGYLSDGAAIGSGVVPTWFRSAQDAARAVLRTAARAAACP